MHDLRASRHLIRQRRLSIGVRLHCPGEYVEAIRLTSQVLKTLATFTFIKDNNGKVTQVLIRQKPADYPAKRIRSLP